METKDIIQAVEDKLRNTKGSIEESVEKIVGKQRFHAELFWGIVAASVIVSILATLIGSTVALYTYRDQINTAISPQLKVLEVKQEQIQQTVESKIDSLKEQLSDFTGKK